MTKTVVISGAANGLGREAAKRLSAAGWTVFAGDVDEAGLASLKSEAGTHPLRLDVTSDESVQAAVAQVRAETDGLDGIVNFAGILAVGSMVELPVAEFERVINVNVLGTARVNRAFFPLLHVRRGRVVNISSETGWQSGAPFNGAYASSKHAIEAYSDSLRRELALLGMHVIKIQPGPFRTAMVESIERRFEAAAAQSEHFGALLRRVGGLALREAKNAHDPEVLAEVVERALTSRRPRPAYSVRPDRARSALEKLPERVADAVLQRVLGRMMRE